MYLSLLKYLGPPFILFLVLLGVYYKGKSNAQKTETFNQMKLVIERLKVEHEVIEQGQKIRKKIDRVKQLPPQVKDAPYSCFLSNELFSTKCDPLLSPL